MYWLVALMVLMVVGVIALGIYLELRPGWARSAPPRWLRAAVGANMVLFGVALAGVLVLGIGEVMAQAIPAAGAKAEISTGLGLALIGVGIPTGIAALGAGIALGPVGSASLAVLVEKPEVFGRTLVYMGLAEGVAIYGLVMSILILGKL